MSNRRLLTIIIVILLLMMGSLLGVWIISKYTHRRIYDYHIKVKGNRLFIYNKLEKVIGCDEDSSGQHCIGDILNYDTTGIESGSSRQTRPQLSPIEVLTETKDKRGLTSIIYKEGADTFALDYLTEYELFLLKHKPIKTNNRYIIDLPEEIEASNGNDLQVSKVKDTLFITFKH